MSGQTALDAAHAAMEAAPADDVLRLQFYQRLADAELFVLLEREAVAETFAPQIFAIEGGDTVLAFDSEDRLAGFVGGPAPYAALPGRVIARLLAAQGLGLAVNPGLASGHVMPVDAVGWLAQTLDNAPKPLEARPELVEAPTGLPEALLLALDATLARAAGLARCAYLVGVRYAGNRRGHLLAFVDARAGAEPALAQAAAEALTFSGVEAGEMDVGFFAPTDAFAAQLARHGLRFDLTAAAPAPRPAPTAPGSDPGRPPILR